MNFLRFREQFCELARFIVMNSYSERFTTKSQNVLLFYSHTNKVFSPSQISILTTEPAPPPQWHA